MGIDRAAKLQAAQRLLIISPVRNEERHIELAARAIGAQTRPPDLWLIVDDGSTDRTPDLLRLLSDEIAFAQVLATPTDYTEGGVDRHALAASPRAFNWALRQVDWNTFTHLGKLDGDIELPPDYFEQLLRRFARDASLGVAGGTLVEPSPRGTWQRATVPSHHVRGALKLYSRSCFEAIGGIEELLGWDTIDETSARMRGFGTRSFEDLVARHHRPVATANGRLRGQVRYGRAFYMLRYGPLWAALRSLKVAARRPVGISGAAFICGYLLAAGRSEPKVRDAEYGRFVRHELRARMRRSSRLRARV